MLVTSQKQGVSALGLQRARSGPTRPRGRAAPVSLHGPPRPGAAVGERRVRLRGCRVNARDRRDRLRSSSKVSAGSACSRFPSVTGQSDPVIEAVVGPVLHTDGWPGLCRHTPTSGRDAQAERPGTVVMPGVHRVASLLQRWLVGTHRVGQPDHLDAYLSEFTFRFRRHSRRRGLLTACSSSPSRPTRHLPAHAPRATGRQATPPSRPGRVAPVPAVYALGGKPQGTQAT